MITYEWTCACGITIKTTTDKQMDTAKERHYRKHAKAAGWGLEATDVPV